MENTKSDTDTDRKKKSSARFTSLRSRLKADSFNGGIDLKVKVAKANLAKKEC